VPKFSRSELRKARRRIGTVPGPAGERQAVVAYLSMLCGDEKPVVLSPEEALILPIAICIV
jgi:hypothetical protein